MARSPLLSTALSLLLSGTGSGLLAQDDLNQKVKIALEQARPALLAHLRDATDSSTRAGVLALLVLAATHDGVDAADPVFGKALQRLARSNPTETYDLALRLMVCEAQPALPDRPKLAKHDTKDLLQRRSDRGGFGYSVSPSNWDLSNTQYAALGLRAARALGMKVERTVWAQMATEIAQQQDAYGGFNYTRRRSGFDSYASMTAAGIAVMAICRQELGDDSNLAATLDKQVERGWKWFARNKATIGSAKERWSLYFHYGLERAAILSDVTEVDGADWYALGAQMLIEMQLGGGGWKSDTDGFPGQHLDRGRGDAVPTSFAILFLRRKFQKIVGPITPHVVTLAAVGPHSKKADVDACAAELVRRGKEAMPEVVVALRSEIEPQRRAAAAALHGIAGEGFGYDPALDGAANQVAVRRAELWYLKNR